MQRPVLQGEAPRLPKEGDSMECLLCSCSLPAQYGEVFTSHLQQHHRTFSHHLLLFKLSQLGTATIQIMLSLSGGSDVTENVITNNMNLKPYKLDLASNELQLNQDVKDLLDPEDLKPATELLDFNGQIHQSQSAEEFDFNEDEVTKVKKENFEIHGGSCEGNNKKSPQKKIVYSEEERTWCIEIYHGFGGKNGWDNSFVQEFSKKFPAREKAPSLAGVKGMVKWGAEVRPPGRVKHKSDICDQCGFVATTINQWRNHKRRYHSLPKACETCGEIVQESKMKAHILQYHTADEEKKFKCSFCGKGFHKKEKLNIHELVHGDLRPYPCKFKCGFASKSPNNIKVHEKVCKVSR